MTSGVFGLKKVYKRQVQNVTDNNFNSWPEIFDGGTIGYFGGGYVGAPAPIQLFNNLTKLQFYNDTVSESASSLPTNLSLGGECSNGKYGYFVGGITQNPAPPPDYNRVNTITRLDFSNETVSSPGNNLPTVLSQFGSVSSTNYGYFGGGYNGTFPTIGGTYEIKKFDFLTETATSLSASLFANPGTTGRGRLAGVSSKSYGYFGGGITPSNGSTFTNVTRLDYSTESSTSLGNILPPSGAKDFGATDSNDAGYFGGGYNPSFVNTITRLDFTTENVSLPGNNLPFAGTKISALSNKLYGYFGGAYVPNDGSLPVPTARSTIVRLDFYTESMDVSGSRNLPTNKFDLISTTDRGIKRINQVKTYGYFGGGSPVVSTITRLDFSNETVSDPGNNLLPGRNSIAGTSSNSYGYFGGGNTSPPATNICTITRIDFSSETVSDPGKNLPTARNGMAAVSSSSYGYFGAGYDDPYTCTITRLDFSSETVSDPGKNLPRVRGRLAAVSSSSYGYFGGGTTPSGSICTITRLDFSNETVSNPGNNLPTVILGLAATSSNSYGYFGGGLAPSYINTITRLDFSSETVSDPGNNLLASRSDLAGTSSNFYGYFGGGSSTTAFSTITRLDFSNEIVSDPGNNLVPPRSRFAAVSNSN